MSVHVDEARAGIRSDRATPEFLARLAERVSVGGPRESLEIKAPVTGETIGTVPLGTEQDVVDAAARARAAQVAWAARPLRERTEIFLRFHDLVLDRRQDILDIIELEAGKARKDAFEEVLDVANVARYYARNAEDHLRPKRRRGAMPGLTQTVEVHRPLGVVGFIVPWNYPFVLGITDTIPALIAGTGAVVKPDQQTPYSALWAATLLDEAGLPRELLHVVTGRGSELGTPLIQNVDYMMFTGSTAVGRQVAAQCGERLIGCSMELGGKNAMLVLDDADLDKAVDGAVRGSFSNVGQLCISMERIFVHERLYDDFARRFAERAAALKLGSGEHGDVGSLISEKQLRTVTEHVEDAVSKGATVLTGGKPRPDLGPYFHEPTVLADVTAEMRLQAEETFGPVVSLYRVADEEEAIRRANDSDYGLNFCVWTRDGERGRRVAERLDAGTVNVNEAYAAAWASTDAPMGGFKASGVGRRHGAHGIQKYTEAQTIAVQRLAPIAAPRGMGQKAWERMTTASLRLLRRAPGKR